MFRYQGWNPNGSRRGIAGISNAAGNVVGLMPHPEHAVEPGFGPDGAAGPAHRHRRAAVLHVGPQRPRRLSVDHQHHARRLGRPRRRSALRTAQQAELLALYGEDDIGHEMTGESIVAMLLVRVDGEAVACGAIRDASAELGAGVGELKRMFVVPAHRGRGLLARGAARARARRAGAAASTGSSWRPACCRRRRSGCT